MNIYNLLDEYDLSNNDVRWYLSNRLSFSLLEFKNSIADLTKYIESGQLEVDLYNMEENYLQEIQDLIDRDKIDEVNLREILGEMVILKKKRFI